MTRFVLTLLLFLAACAHAGDETKTPAKTHKGQGKDPGKGPTSKPSKPLKAPDLVKPRGVHKALLDRYEKEAEPSRELKRAFLSVLHYLFARDVERVLPYFHPELMLHTGAGELRKVTPKQLRKLFESQRGEPPPGKGKPLAKLAKLETLTLISYERIKSAKKDEELAKGFDVDPKRMREWLKPGDWLVLVRFHRTPEASDLPAEAFYAFRRDKKRFKVILAE